MIQFMILSLIFSMIFMCLNHPLSFGLMLLLQTISVSLISGMMSFNFWYSYMIFLIMIGGMLVLFLYMTNVASNEKFKISMNMMIFLILFLLYLMTFFIDNQLINFINNNYLMIYMNLNLSFLKSILKFLTFPSHFIYIMIIIYLFITLIAIVKITNIKYGPLRQMN
uniref:NADH-ubiquinone oxidoreductase chain 6 n=1 Tax=Laemophloeidae sp. KM-2017 TaxID=2219439 RepID=A0A346RHI1_9CUCU|nr:NADH dehydrogenase subunit 6 [Laemophloeidae sp. KM-2017]